MPDIVARVLEVDMNAAAGNYRVNAQVTVAGTAGSPHDFSAEVSLTRPRCKPTRRSSRRRSSRPKRRRA